MMKKKLISLALVLVLLLVGAVPVLAEEVPLPEAAPVAAEAHEHEAGQAAELRGMRLCVYCFSDTTKDETFREYILGASGMVIGYYLWSHTYYFNCTYLEVRLLDTVWLY